MPPHSFQSPRSLAAFVLLVSQTSGAILNTTFDDTSSAFSWTSGSWTAVSAANPCNGCSAKPSIASTSGQTYHDGSYEAGDPEMTTGSFTFTGSAVYIYGLGHADDGADIIFTLGNSQTPFHYTGDNDWTYNVLYFSADNLDSSDSQTVSWILNTDPSTVNKHSQQIAMFDFALVTPGEDKVNVPKPVPPTTSPGDGSGGSGGSGGSNDSKPGTSTSSSSSQTPTTNNPGSVSSSSSRPSSANSIPSSSGGTEGTSSRTVTTVGALSSGSSGAISTTNGTSNGSPASESNPNSDPGAGNIPLSSSISSKHHMGVALIVGIAVGILILGVLGVIAFFLWHRRRRTCQGSRQDNRVIQPFAANSARLPEKPAALSLSTVSLLDRHERDTEEEDSPSSTSHTDRETRSSSPTETSAVATPSAAQPIPIPTPIPTREQMLEDRIAELEAQMAAPPPYV
ncbi:hypothetical protein FB45DRAFT_872576 [Roridomyces roridus]|uniref:Mid2 domain-containing protein n=1 Tax=Roridomyces roridus TaxID=1738132 RepID=A0AAD7BCH4_9AGAR|nr:hypothetical protein FB45DRAFT_872576 [Roridomyces roridus]